MSKKSKSLANPMAELNFVAAVQLEEAVQMVGDMADTQHEVTLTELSEDVFKFQINYLPNNSKESEIWGTLQRWQGTDTKIDASGEALRTAVNNKSNTLALLSLILLFSIPTTWAITNILNNGQSDLEMLELLGILGFNFLLYGLFIRQGMRGKQLVFRARDYLLQRVVDTFKSVAKAKSYE